MQTINERQKVWDPMVRIFHWSLILFFTITYLTEDEWLDLHVTTAYVVTGLVIFRVFWGFIGGRHARFSQFVRSPRTVRAYLKDVLAFKAKRYVGHNPAGGAMVLALIFSLTATIITGMVIYGYEELSGPLAGYTSTLTPFIADVIEESHELFASMTVFLIFMHVIGVLIASFQHQENLIHSMVHGYKKVSTHD